MKTLLNLLYSVLLELILTLAVSGAGSVLSQVPGPLPGYPLRAVLFCSGSARSCRAVGVHRLPVAICS
nr:MAG TPA: hypothetical protein [Caudoviricetes sp.]